MPGRFKDRSDAAKQLAARLGRYAGEGTVVLALPRGGVVLGVEIAKALGTALDLVIARKIGAPFNEEYAIAAVAEDGDAVLTDQAKAGDAAWFEEESRRQMGEARRRRVAYLGNRPRPSLAGKTALVVDDGIATGLTMRVALKEIAHRGPARVVIAVPVAPTDVAEELRGEVDEVVALRDLEFGSIGASYEEFGQVSDAEVTAMMERV